MNPDLKQVLIATIPSVLPVFMVGFGILVNKNDSDRLKGDMDSLSNRLGGEIAMLRARMESRFDTLTKDLHDNVETLVKVGNDLDKRISRLEDKG